MPTAIEQLAALIRGPEPKRDDEFTVDEMAAKIGKEHTPTYRLLSQQVARGVLEVRQTLEHRPDGAYWVNVYRVRKPDEQAHPQD